jgi:hypothetical protein
VRLTDVDLRGTTAGEAAWRALIRSPHRAALKRLRLEGALVWPSTTQGGATPLREHPALRQELEARFGAEALDFDSELECWVGHKWSERPTMEQPPC